MTDIIDTKTRSRMMAGIRSKSTWPETLVRSLLHRTGFGSPEHLAGYQVDQMSSSLAGEWLFS